MSFFNELINEQDDPSMGRLHVAAQTRGSASASTICRIGHPSPICSHELKMSFSIRSRFALAHPCANQGLSL